MSTPVERLYQWAKRSRPRFARAKYMRWQTKPPKRISVGQLSEQDIKRLNEILDIIAHRWTNVPAKELEALDLEYRILLLRAELNDQKEQIADSMVGENHG